MFKNKSLTLALPFLVAACGADSATSAPAAFTKEDAFTSARASLLVFEFQGELLTANSWSAEQYIKEQLFFTIGQLNGHSSVGRLDRLEILDKQILADLSGLKRILYQARMPVAWGSKSNLPTQFTFRLPRRADQTGQQAFADKYKESCVDWGAHDVDVGSMWYYYRPAASGCKLEVEDIVELHAQVTISSENTSGKYPEYHQVWADGSLQAVAIFGKNEADDDSNSDAGIAAYNEFLRLMKDELGSDVATVPAEVPVDPGVKAPDVVLRKTLPDGRRIEVVALLIDSVRSAPPSFDARYEQLTPTADVVMYFGHSGLGANIRALARKGRFSAGQYQIYLMNGCDTFAYVDSALADAHRLVNPDDLAGTRYLDMLTNAMPAGFHANADNGRALIRALAAYDQPLTYEKIFTSFDSRQVVVVTGEEDNVYYPGFNPGAWAGFDRADAVERGEWARLSIPGLAAGRYLFTMEPQPGQPAGDADLYVRTGAEPTLTEYDCRPYSGGSAEQCELALKVTSDVHVGVYGYSAGTTHVLLTGRALAGAPEAWSGMRAEGTVARGEEQRFATPVLPAGRYELSLTGTADADLYVRVGAEPTATVFDCRPYRSDSTESCTMTLAAGAALHIMVRGYSTESTFVLVGAEI